MTTWQFTHGKRKLVATRVEKDGKQVWHLQANCPEWAEIVREYQGRDNTDALYFALTDWVLAHHKGETIPQKRRKQKKAA